MLVSDRGIESIPLDHDTLIEGDKNEDRPFSLPHVPCVDEVDP